MRTPYSLSLLALLLSACGGDKATEGQNAGECADGADNDADGAFDCNDTDCAGSPDCAGANAAPSGVAITITPAAPGPDDALTCTIVTEAVDPDGDAVSYRYAWTVDGASAGITEATVPSTLTEGGQAWICTVTPTDGTLDGTSSSASVTIVQANRAPSAPTVAIVPEAPSDDDVLNCVITGESMDPDGDTVSYSYSWTVNGASAGVTTATVGAERTRAGETWACSVVASDGELTSGAGTASVGVVEACNWTVADLYGDGDDSDCDSGDWDAGTASTGAHYVIVAEWRDRTAAADRCLDLGYERLAEFYSFEEAELVWDLPSARYLGEHSAAMGGGTRLWIGLSADAGFSRWPSGEAVSVAYWDTREPSGDGACVELDIGRTHSSPGLWNDISCATELPFVCERRR